MLLTKDQLAMSLCELTQGDYNLLNDIIIEYVDLIDDNKFNDLEQYVNNNMNELMWTLLTTTVMLLNVIITECNKLLTLSSKSFIILNVNERELISPLFNNNCSSTIYQQLMNYYTSLVKQIDQIQSSGKIVKLTKLPSVVNIKRKAIKF